MSTPMKTSASQQSATGPGPNHGATPPVPPAQAISYSPRTIAALTHPALAQNNSLPVGRPSPLAMKKSPSQQNMQNMQQNLPQNLPQNLQQPPQGMTPQAHVGGIAMTPSGSAVGGGLAMAGTPSNGGVLTFDSPMAFGASLGLDLSALAGSMGMGLDVGGMFLSRGRQSEDERLRRLDLVLATLQKTSPGAVAATAGTDTNRMNSLTSMSALGRGDQRYGLVSEAGLERLVNRTGLDCIWDIPGGNGGTGGGGGGGGIGSSMGSSMGGSMGGTPMTTGGRKTLIIAGKAVNIDVEFENNIVQSVSLSFPELAPTVNQYVDRAAGILLQDLELGPGQSPLTKTLDAFAANLGRLAVLDRLSVLPGLDCQEALVGLCTSLERLYRWDLARVETTRESISESTSEPTEDHPQGQPAHSQTHIQTQTQTRTQKEALMTVLCQGHGWPRMHVRGRVGLSLVYWTEKRRIPELSLDPATRVQTSIPRDPNPDTRKDHQDNNSDEDDDEDDDEGGETWSLLISCEAQTDMSCPPIRVSSEWISELVEKQNVSEDELAMAPDGVVLDWLEPMATLLPSQEDVDMMGPDPDGAHNSKNAANNNNNNNNNSNNDNATTNAQDGGRLPNVIFTATLDPPVVLPQHILQQIQAMILTPLRVSPSVAGRSTFDTILLPPDGTLAAHSASEYDVSEPRTLVVGKKRAFCPRDQHVGRGGDEAGRRAEALGGEDRVEWRAYTNTLFVYKPAYGGTLTSIAFAHPRQLTSILPVLRQYAFLGTLLRKSFASSEAPMEACVSKTSSTHAATHESKTTSTSTLTSPVSALSPRPTGPLSDHPSGGHTDRNCEPASSVSRDPLRVDVTLTVHPVPRLQVVFPLVQGKTAHITVEIRSHGEVVVTSDNILNDDAAVAGHAEALSDAQGAGGQASAENTTTVKQEDAMDVDMDKDMNKDKDVNKDKDKDMNKDMDVDVDATALPINTKTAAPARARITRQHLARALETLEDLDQWCEWIQTRVACAV